MEIKSLKTRIFRENEDLSSFVLEHIKKIPENSILVITSKIVALTEGRVVKHKSEKQKDELIKKESDFAIKTKGVWLTLTDGMLLANAGIDESNAQGKLILLPKNSFKTAEKIRQNLVRKFKIKNLGIVIADSRLLPLRSGAVGIALGYAGFEGVKSYVNKKDIFGRVLKMSKTDVADSLATAAVLCMGEGNERKPLALITGAPITFKNKINKKEINISRKKDIYAPLFNKFN
jgi:F420-0:gamma-glutamyl ligase